MIIAAIASNQGARRFGFDIVGGFVGVAVVGAAVAEVGMGEKLTGSPPLRVIKARSVLSSIFLVIAWTEPSQKAALKISGYSAPSLGSGFSGSKGKSSGLVHGTGSPAST